MASKLTSPISERASQYQHSLLALLPKGSAWSQNPDSELGRLMAGLAEELARIDQRALDLLNESHPSSAQQTFELWEAEFGLPDPCSGNDPSRQERLEALLQNYRMQGNPSRDFYIEMAAIMGYEITITEYQSSYYGDLFGVLYGDERWAFVWQINVPKANFRNRHYGEPWGEKYRVWSNQRLECVFNRLKHAHTYLIFSY